MKDDNKLDDKIILRKRKCPICNELFTYFCIKCVEKFLKRDPIKNDTVYTKTLQKLKDFMQNSNFNKLLDYVFSLEEECFFPTIEKINSLFNYLQKCPESTALKDFLMEKLEQLDEEKPNYGQYPQQQQRHFLSLPAPPVIKAESCPSVSSVRSKKSNLISNFIKKAKLRKNKDTQKNQNVERQDCSSVNSYCSFNEVEMQTDLNFVRPNLSLLEIKEHEEFNNPSSQASSISVQSSNIAASSSPKVKNHSFFRKLIKKSLTDALPPTDEHCIQTTYTTCDAKNSCKHLQMVERNVETLDEDESDGVADQNPKKQPLSFILGTSRSTKQYVDISLKEGLFDLQVFSKTIRDSEAHLLALITKFIANPNVKKELLDTLSHHSILQWEAQKRSSALASEMWHQQIDISRHQERNLQDTLFSVIRQNRMLQSENEDLFRKNEKLLLKLRTCPDLKCKTFDIMENPLVNITKNNERLQRKNQALVKELETYEKEMIILQKQNEGLEDHSRSYLSELQDLKAQIQRNRTEYELENASINFQLKTTEDTMKQSMDAADILLEDLDSVKKQLKGLNSNINWSKFKYRGSCLTDLIHLSRSFINELVRELVSARSDLSLKDKDICGLRETNGRLQENLHKSTQELNQLSTLLQEKSNLGGEKNMLEAKCCKLEKDLERATFTNNSLKDEFANEKNMLLNQIRSYEQINFELLEKDKLIDESKNVITTITTDNYALRAQVDGLNKILKETGAGDMAKELISTQEKVSYIHDQCCQLASEKDYLIQQLNTITLKNEKLESLQEKVYDEVKNAKQSMDFLQQEKTSYIHQQEEQKKTINYLQNERMKYLEEKNVLKSIFTHLKAELNRVQTLEGTITDMSKEANRLMLVAEYNRQLGEKLKSEVEEKDLTILELKTSVEHLNSIAIENTKDKLSLAAELTEVITIKEKLNDSLVKEAHKRKVLHKNKKQIECSTSSKLKKLEEVHITSRKEMEELMIKYWQVSEEKNQLLEQQSQLKKEIDSLKSETNSHLKVCDNYLEKSGATDEKIKEISKKLEQQDGIIKELLNKIKNEGEKYELTIEALDECVKQLNVEKEDMEKSLEYLKNTCSQLNDELNRCRTSEKESKKELQNLSKEKNKLQQVLDSVNTEMKARSNEYLDQNKELEYLRQLCTQLLKDFENTVDATLMKENMFKNEIEASKLSSKNIEEAFNNLKKVLCEKEEKVQSLTADCERLKQENLELFDHFNNSDKKSNEKWSNIKKQKDELEKRCHNLEVDHKGCSITIENMKKEIHKLHTQVQEVVKQKEKDNHYFKTSMEDLFKEYNERKLDMKKDIDTLSDQIEIAQNLLRDEKLHNQKLYENNNILSTNLKAALMELKEEKKSSHESRPKILELEATVANLTAEKAFFKDQMHIMANQLNKERHIIDELINEKEAVQIDILDTQDKYNEVVAQCDMLENELKEANDRLRENKGKYEVVTKNQEVSTDSISKVSIEIETDFDDEPKIKSATTSMCPEKLKVELDECYEIIAKLKDNLANMEQKIIGLEFQKCELTLRLHEIQGNLETHRALSKQLKDENQSILTAILRLKEDGKVTPSDCTDILYIVNSQSNLTNTSDPYFTDSV